MERGGGRGRGGGGLVDVFSAQFKGSKNLKTFLSDRVLVEAEEVLEEEVEEEAGVYFKDALSCSTQRLDRQKDSMSSRRFFLAGAGRCFFFCCLLFCGQFGRKRKDRESFTKKEKKLSLMRC